MKKYIILVICASAVSAHAQVTVFDPTMNVQQIIDTAQEVAKYVVMIDNQVQQIQTLSSQLTQFKNYEALFGTPANVSLPTTATLVTDLDQTETGKPLISLESGANANQAMTYTGGGLYQTVGTTFNTPGGQTITRQQAPYLPMAAVQNATANYLTVSGNAETERVQLKQNIATTIEQLKAATTDADVQKLTAVLVGYSSALDSVDHELNQAAASTTVQDIANRTDTQRQTEAQLEQQHAEFTEALQKYGQTFQLMDQPTQFPTGQ